VGILDTPRLTTARNTVWNGDKELFLLPAIIEKKAHSSSLRGGAWADEAIQEERKRALAAEWIWIASPSALPQGRNDKVPPSLHEAQFLVVASRMQPVCKWK
jgi:hypothetical protein